MSMPTQMIVVAPDGHKGLSRPAVDRLARELARLSPRQPVVYVGVVVTGPIPAGTTIARAHRNWNADNVATRGTWPGFPKRSEKEACLPDAWLIEFDLSTSGPPRPSMGSYYGYDGVFLSAIVIASSMGLLVWDIRVEDARR